MAVFCCRHAVVDSDSVSSTTVQASTDRLKDVRSFEVEEHRGKSRASQDVIPGLKSSEVSKETQRDFLSTVDKMSMSSQTIFDLMKARVTDRKVSEERTNRSSSHRRTKSPSEHREVDDRNERRSLSRSRDSAGHLMPGEELIGNSRHEYTSYGQDSIRHPLSSSMHQIPQLYRSEASDVDRDERYHSSHSQNIAALTTPDSDLDLRSTSGHQWMYGDDPSLPSTSCVEYLHQSEPAAAAGTNASDFSLSDVQWLDSWTNASHDFDYRNYRKDY